ncbi:hypothetical protein EX895_004648 [Sporisorium graminicola]|uniref:Uncharacterized protein n=1 Tax=Sporisorium graminicola TaxID=280036 RepID=A0A4V6ETG4_9BASI|nr:hypothetical protein EX895_004648 [Sporisorium graminicola]TKY86499.1 hypothetical protein EX895_004648 [Sporisorium graminicola]
MASTNIAVSTDFPVRHYWLMSNGRRLMEEESVHVPYVTQPPLTKCIVVGVEGTSFSFRISKDAYPDGVHVYIRGAERGSWTWWLKAKPDYPYIYRSEEPKVTQYIPPYWEFDVGEWVFGRTNAVRAVVLGRDEFGEYDGKGTQTLYQVESIPPEWQGASQDAFLVERLNSISIRDDPSSSSPAPPIAAGLYPPLIEAPSVVSPVAGPTAPTAPTALQQATQHPQTGTSFDPLAAARLATGSRGVGITPPGSSGRGMKRACEGAWNSASTSLTSFRADKQRDCSPQEPRPYATPAAASTVRAGKQPERSARRPRQEVAPPILSHIRAGQHGHHSPQEPRQGQSRSRRQQSPHPGRVQGQVIKDQPETSLGPEQPGKSCDVGPAPIARQGLVRIPPRSAPTVSDDSDDDVPLDQLVRTSRRGTFARTYAHRVSPLPRRSGRLQSGKFSSTLSATPDAPSPAPDGRSVTPKKVDLTPRPYISNKADIDLLKSFWHLPRPVSGYYITAGPDVRADEQLDESDWLDESEDEDGQQWLTRKDMPEWMRLIVGPKAQEPDGQEIPDEPWRVRAMPEDAPLPVNSMRGKGKRRGKQVGSKLPELRKVGLTGVERSDLRFVDAAMQERWDRLLGRMEFEKSQAKTERIKQQKEKGARSLPCRR